jgi:hypothetical protein
MYALACLNDVLVVADGAVDSSDKYTASSITPLALNVSFLPGYICAPYNASTLRQVAIKRFEVYETATFSDTLTSRQKVRLLSALRSAVSHSLASQSAFYVASALYWTVFVVCSFRLGNLILWDLLRGVWTLTLRPL